jgi:hypothetical protein
MDDSLKESIRCILDVAIEPLSEYQLIQLLNEQGWSLPTSAINSLDLFTSHFLVYNALYQLQTEYWLQQQYLEITALAIRLLPTRSDSNQASLLTNYSAEQALRDYYLDLSHLHTATTQSVDSLLNSFWERMIASDDSSKALAVFSLSMPVTFSAVKQRYRHLAMTHHPDRGGDPARFQEINWAFGVLQKIVR